MNKIGEENFQINSKMLYYLKQKAAKKLISLHLINKPKSYEFSKTYKKKDGTDFQGYNEIDVCFTLSKDIKIEENENLSALKYCDNTKNVIQSSIQLEKDIRYITEIKSNIKDIIDKKSLSEIKKKYQRFNEAFKNIKKVQNIKTHNQKSSLLLLSDKSIKEVKIAINSNQLKENFIYSNPQVGMSFIFELNDKINYINNKTSKEIATLKEAINNGKSKIVNSKEPNNNDISEITTLKVTIKNNISEIATLKEATATNNLQKDKEIATLKETIATNNLQTDKEIATLKETIATNNLQKDKEIATLKEKIKDNESDMKYLKYDIYDIKRESLQNFNFIKPDLLAQNHSANKEVSIKVMNSLGELFSCFDSLSKSYLEIKRIQGEKTLYEDIKPFIGKYLETNEGIEQWKVIYEKISKKAKKNSVFSKYYQSLSKLLFGEKYINNNLNSIDKDILSQENSEKRNMINKLILFLEVCTENEKINLIESKFQSVLYYICLNLEIKTVMNELFKIGKENKTPLSDIFTELISCINAENVNFLIIK